MKQHEHDYLELKALTHAQHLIFEALRATYEANRSLMTENEKLAFGQLATEARKGINDYCAEAPHRTMYK